MNLRETFKPLLSWLPYEAKQGGTYRTWSRFLPEAERWPRERIEAWQLERLRAVVRHAIAHTEGYRELYRKAGVTADDMRSLADVRRLPMVSKQMLQENLAAFTAPTPGAYYTTTGGSTGIPFGFHVTRADERRESAFVRTSWREVGWDPRMPTAVLRGVFIGSRERVWRYEPFWRSLELSSYFLTPQTLPTYVEQMHRHRIEVLHAYPSSMLLFCDLLADSGLKLDPAPRFAMLGSENLYDWQLERYAAALPRTRVFSWYGHAEMAVFAPWCEHSRRFHLSPFYGLSELLDPQGNPVAEGQSGEIVGTSLHERATPFIRYQTMDSAVRGPETCPDCGRAFPTLEKIAGRLQEVIVTRTGRYISMTAINFHDRIFDRLRQFQFVQEAPGKLVFRYIPKSPLSEADARSIFEGLMKKLGDDVELQMTETERIELTARGKLRFLDQKLPIAYGDR
jgi:phenylacetate-CoA ligase